MRSKREAYFWTAYADLITNLFFIMLALYAISFYLLYQQKKIAEEQLEKIRAMEESVQKLDDTGYFTYEPVYKRFILKEQVNFRRGDTDIHPVHYAGLMKVGNEIRKITEEGLQDENLRYLIIIEGMASKDNYSKNYELSYGRALSLYNLWKKGTRHSGGPIRFNPDRTEIIISGSGTGGVGRSKIERDNQRFLIQVIPKFKLD